MSIRELVGQFAGEGEKASFISTGLQFSMKTSPSDTQLCVMSYSGN